MDAVTPPRAGRNRGAALLAAAPLVLLLAGAVFWRGLYPVSHVPLTPTELPALNAARLQADESAAYEAAQKEVRAFLLHPNAQASARFPGHLTGRNVTIEKRSPTRFRVRGIVEWQPESGGPHKTQPVQTRRFEADLLHGPADDKWRLIDTEFLDAAPR